MWTEAAMEWNGERWSEGVRARGVTVVVLLVQLAELSPFIMRWSSIEFATEPYAAPVSRSALATKREGTKGRVSCIVPDSDSVL